MVVTTVADRERLIEVRLTQGVEVHVLVTDPQGRPYANAEVLQYRGFSYPPLRWTADASGRVVLRLAPTDSRQVFVIPREGSFVIAQIDSRTGREPDAPERVVVPRPAGLLRLGTVDRDGKPVPDAILAIRFNGIAIPGQILREIGRRQGVDFQTGFDGSVVFRNLPAGRYEVWARGPIRVPTALEVPSKGKPAVIDFLGGDHELVVTTGEQ